MEKKVDYSKQGKKNRAAGVRFEAKVRADLKSQGWIVSKWMNNIDFEKDDIVPAKRKYNPFLKALSIGTGFPDFIVFKLEGKKYEVVGIEVKRQGYLDKEERKKCRWYLKNKIFSKILIAKGIKECRAIKVKYIDFQEKYGDKNE